MNKQFEQERQARLNENGQNTTLKASAAAFMKESTAPKYSYNFSWMGRPIIQYPQDIMAMQELIWSIQPDLIIETGIALRDLDEVLVSFHWPLLPSPPQAGTLIFARLVRYNSRPESAW